MNHYANNYSQAVIHNPGSVFGRSCAVRFHCLMVADPAAVSRLLWLANSLESCWDGHLGFDIQRAADIDRQIQSVIAVVPVIHPVKASLDEISNIARFFKKAQVVLDTALRVSTKLADLIKRDVGIAGLSVVLSIGKQIVKFIKWLANYMDPDKLDEFFSFDHPIINRVAQSVGKLKILNTSFDAAIEMINRFIDSRHAMHEGSRTEALVNIGQLLDDIRNEFENINDLGLSRIDWAQFDKQQWAL